jgi:transglutaminase/protease-like cytokinesis protein 3
MAQVSDFKSINFTIADNVASLNEGSSLENLPLLAYKLTHKLPTQVEKFRAIYTWVCNNIEGDYYQHEKVNRTRKKFQNDSLGYIKWNNGYKKTAFKTLRKHKKTMCTGYAYLIKELCFLANIACEIVDGYGRSINANVEQLEMTNHSWNAVKLNNKWYLCDATWSSGYIDENNNFVNDYNEGYFLTDPTLFAKNHYPTLQKWLLNATVTPTDFVLSPLVYGEIFKHKVILISPEQMQIKTKENAEIYFSFKRLKNSTLDTVSVVLFSGSNSRPLEIYALKNENKIVNFKYRFEHKGYYDVHLKINNDIVATYTVEVSKR